MFATRVCGVCLRRNVILATLGTTTVSALLLSSLSSILAAEGANPSLAQTLVQNPGRDKAPHATVSPMSRCMATWDPSTQMSKQAWRETCKRMVKENPGLYSKPF